MDLLEIINLLGAPEKEAQDLSLMLNFERKQNGATNEFLNMNQGAHHDD